MISFHAQDKYGRVLLTTDNTWICKKADYFEAGSWYKDPLMDGMSSGEPSWMPARIIDRSSAVAAVKDIPSMTNSYFIFLNNILKLQSDPDLPCPD